MIEDQTEDVVNYNFLIEENNSNSFKNPTRAWSVCWRYSWRSVWKKGELQDQFPDHHRVSNHAECLPNCPDILPRTLLARFAIQPP